MKKISVLMTTYNHEKYIEQAIESVLMQEGNFEIELLIGNDKSPDKTVEVLKKYENNSKIKIFNRERNIGANNNGWDLFTKSNGDYIAILEGDDYWITKDKLEKQLNLLETNEKSILCYTDSYIIDENNKIIGKKYVKKNNIKNINSLMLNRGGIPTGTIFFRNIFLNSLEKDSLEKIIKSSEIIGDLSLFTILIKKGEFSKLDEITGVYRYITNSKKSTSYSSRSDLFKEFELYKVFKGIAEYYKFDNIKKFFFIQRREYKLRKLIKRENENLEKYFGKITLKKKVSWIIYDIFKILDDLYWSIMKKIEYK